MGILYIVGTPIGNMEDITIRAIKTLFAVDYIACEDTRKTGQLLAYLEKCHPELVSGSTTDQKKMLKQVQHDNGKKKPQLISYYDEIEFKRIPELIELLQNDKNIALVSDSGTPLISDPGFKLVGECINRNIKIIPIPGSSSVLTALIVSGLPANDFRFIGFLPVNKSKRQKLLKSIYLDPRPRTDMYTIIAFETSHRLKDSLEDLKKVFGDIEIVIARELTKIHEEIWRGKISEAIKRDFKGEIIILFNIPQA